MAFADQFKHLATLFKSPVSLMVYLAAFWEYGIAPVVQTSLALLVGIVVLAFLVQYQEEVTRLCQFIARVLQGMFHYTRWTLRAAYTTQKRIRSSSSD